MGKDCDRTWECAQGEKRLLAVFSRKLGGERGKSQKSVVQRIIQGRVE